MNALIQALVVCVCLLDWVAVLHVLLTKKDPRGTLGWIAVIFLSPLLGILLYIAFGISRTQSRATRIMQKLSLADSFSSQPEPLREAEDNMPPHVAHLERLGRHLTQQYLCGGNVILPLENGDAAYPVMLDSIRNAKKSVFLVTYIFNYGIVGERFITALCQAAERKIDVRVIIDGIGRFYGPSFPKERLIQAGVQLAYFLPPRLFPPSLSINLRNHRKVLICDEIAFTGGMNISDNNTSWGGKGLEIQDMNFRCQGPITYQLRQSFLLDWGFVRGKYETTRLSSYQTTRPGESYCRILLDGPGSPDKLNDIIAGSISSAMESVRIMTPYFLPTREIIAAIRSAAQKGVRVDVILPEKNNIPFLPWATMRILPHLIQAGVHIYLQPAPFAHTKLLAIDDFYCQIGSANFDSRSLRLNFELNIEIFDKKFHIRIAEYMDKKKRMSREILLEELLSLPLVTQIRNATFWLFSPYL